MILCHVIISVGKLFVDARSIGRLCKTFEKLQKKSNEISELWRLKMKRITDANSTIIGFVQLRENFVGLGDVQRRCVVHHKEKVHFTF